MKRVMFLLLMVASGWADELVLGNGTRLQWKQILDLGDTYEVETSDGKKVKLKKADVVRFEKSASAPLAGAAFSVDKGAVADSLLSHVNLAKQVVSGVWSVEPGALITPATPHGRLVIPFDFPAEYDLCVTVAKRRGDGSFYVCLPVQSGKRAMVYLDGTGNVEGGVHGIPETVFKKKSFEDKKVHQLLYSVRSDRFTMTFDGRVMIDWKNPDYAKAVPPDVIDSPQLGLMLGVYETVYSISSLTIFRKK